MGEVCGMWIKLFKKQNAEEFTVQGGQSNKIFLTTCFSSRGQDMSFNKNPEQTVSHKNKTAVVRAALITSKAWL